MIKSFIKEYKYNGFAVIPKIFKNSEIKDLNKRVDEYLSKVSKKNKSNKVHFLKNKTISSIHNIKNFKLINELQNNSKIKVIAKKILGKSPKKFGAEIFAKPAKIGKAVPVHQDNFYWCTKNGSGITIWIALNKSSKLNGGLFYYSGSHEIGLLEHNLSGVPGSSQKLKNLKGLKFFKKKYPKLKPGDCLVHSSMIVHGSNNNFSNLPRRGLTLRYIAKTDSFDKNRMQKYKADLKKNIKRK